MNNLLCYFPGFVTEKVIPFPVNICKASKLVQYKSIKGNMHGFKGLFANGLVFRRNLRSKLWPSHRISLFNLINRCFHFWGSPQQVPRRRRWRRCLFNSHLPINSELISLVRRCDHITATVCLLDFGRVLLQ